MKRGYYILDADNRPVHTNDVLVWGRWFESANPCVDYTPITSEVTVSTVFLSLDHRYSGNGPPLLFETMVFSGDDGGGETHRYTSWDDAKTGHAMIVKRLREKQGILR